MNNPSASPASFSFPSIPYHQEDHEHVLFHLRHPCCNLISTLREIQRHCLVTSVEPSSRSRDRETSDERSQSESRGGFFTTSSDHKVAQ